MNVLPVDGLKGDSVCSKEHLQRVGLFELKAMKNLVCCYQGKSTSIVNHGFVVMNIT
jgi:hypothetical protein